MEQTFSNWQTTLFLVLKCVKTCLGNFQRDDMTEYEIMVAPLSLAQGSNAMQTVFLVLQIKSNDIQHFSKITIKACKARQLSANKTISSAYAMILTARPPMLQPMPQLDEEYSKCLMYLVNK